MGATASQQGHTQLQSGTDPAPTTPAAEPLPAWPAADPPPPPYQPPGPPSSAAPLQQSLGVLGGTWLLPEALWVRLPRAVGGAPVPIRVHYLLGLIPGLGCLAILWSGLAQRAEMDRVFAAMMLVLFSNGLFLYATVLIHEVGHVFAAAHCGVPPVQILLWPLGGLAVCANSAPTHKERIYVAALGPATHAPLCLLWLGLLAGLLGRVTLSTAGLSVVQFSEWCAMLCISQLVLNITMFAFNALVPCFPLDCSTILVNALALSGWRPIPIARCIIGTSVVVITIIVAYALYQLMHTGLGAMMLLLLAGFLAYSTWLVYSALQEGRLAEASIFHDRGPESGLEPTLFERMFGETERTSRRSTVVRERSNMDLGMLLGATGAWLTIDLLSKLS